LTTASDPTFKANDAERLRNDPAIRWIVGKAEFEATWRQWLAWANLCEM
jgi:hypothetical protein